MLWNEKFTMIHNFSNMLNTTKSYILKGCNFFVYGLYFYFKRFQIICKQVHNWGTSYVMLVSADAQNLNLIIHWGMQSGDILILFFFIIGIFYLKILLIFYLVSQ